MNTFGERIAEKAGEQVNEQTGLLSCPFCGGFGTLGLTSVWCDGCGIEYRQDAFATKDSLRRQWNQRVPPIPSQTNAAVAPLVEALRALRGAISDFKGHGMPGFTNRAEAYLILQKVDSLLAKHPVFARTGRGSGKRFMSEIPTAESESTPRGQITQTMKPEAQRIAIAEACGWKRVREDSEAAMRLRDCPSTFLVGVSAINQTEGWENRTTNDWLLPDYLSDLNAMHEAEKVVMTPKYKHQYFGHLVRMLRQDHMSLSAQQWLPVIRATAAQRGEAFLRTLNLWKDETSGVPNA